MEKEEQKTPTPTDIPSKDEQPKGEPEQTSLLSAAADGEHHEQSDPAAQEEKLPPIALTDLKLPKDVQIDDALSKEFLGIFNDTSLSRADLAQKLVDMHVSMQGKFLEAQKAANDAAMAQLAASLDEDDKAWIEAARNHPEYGGANWEASQAVIAKGRDALASPELVKYLVETRQGNNPDLLLMFYRAGKLLMEDQALRGEPSKPRRDPADVSWGDITSRHFER